MRVSFLQAPGALMAMLLVCSSLAQAQTSAPATAAGPAAAAKLPPKECLAALDRLSAGVPREELPRMGHVMVERGHLFVPILIILAGLFLGYSAPLAALVAAICCLPVALLRASTRKGITWMSVLGALEEGARNTLAVAMACACAGIVLGCVTITGLGITFTQVVIALSQNSLVLALALTALAGIVLGMGMPTTPAYIVMVSLLVPAIIKLGAVTPAAHMFAF